jgi:putative glycosyltransferase (TIGR04372 family)
MNSLNFFSKNINEIKKGGFPIFYKKTITVIKLILILLSCVLSVPILLIIYAINPKFLIRFQPLTSNRIGHFSANTELYLCEKEMKINTPKQRYIDLFFCYEICNFQLHKMLKKKINILPKWILYPIFITNRFFSKFFPNLKKFEIKNNSCGDIDIHNLYTKCKNHFNFTLEEEKKGEEYLRKFDLTKDSKFVAISVRDDVYLKKLNLNHNWDYHYYRNQNIANFKLAAEEITKRNYHIFIMGTSGSKKLDTQNKKIINYGNSNLRSDFLDIYLSAKCEFFISAQTGLDGIPRIFRKPILTVNSMANNAVAAFSEKEFILIRPQLKKSENRVLKLDEILSVPYKQQQMDRKHYDANSKDIKHLDSSPEEIRDITIEVMDRLEGKWQEKINDELLQNKFWEKYREKFDIKNENIKLPNEIKAKIGAVFLKKNFNLD